MPRGKKLTLAEIDTIENLKNKNYSVTQIAQIIKRSRHVISNYLSDPENYQKKHAGGRPRAINDRDRRAILRVASNSALTARQIAKEAGVDTHVRNVQRLLKNATHLKTKKLRRKPPLTDHHKNARLKFAQEHISWRKEWQKVIFSDEKKFNLDGPDGFQYYFHDLRKNERILSRRQMGGGSLMVWAGIGYEGKTEINCIERTMNSSRYVNLLDEQLNSYGNEIAGEGYIFQHDNAAVHSAKVVKHFFSEHNIETLTWPARSPDLNIIENCWGELARAVYANAKQFETIYQLKDNIQREWRNMPQDYIRNLYESLQNRMMQVVVNRGGSTHY